MLIENSDAERRWRPRQTYTLEEIRALGYTEDCQVCGVPTDPNQNKLCHACERDDTRRPYGWEPIRG